MKIQINATLMLLIAVPAIAMAQTPVDENGVVVGAYEPAYGVKPQVEPLGNEDIPLLSESDLEDLVGPIALYPDDLLAIVLPASAYPLQIVEAGRFLDDLEDDPSLKPDPEWDDSVVALLNYPEVVELLNDDIDWTWRLGEAVVAQQGDVVTAIESFRDRAYAAGNLKSDDYQKVTRNEGAIEITPVSDDVIYVPYYEPEHVVVYQPRPVYYYYPRAYPVYYYPYSSAYHFDRGYFWGVTTAFTIGWLSDSLHVYHHSYHGHPYYGHHYWDRWWYRRPSIHIYNTTYVRRPNVTINRYYDGDRWEARHERRDYYRDRTTDRVTRNRHTPPAPDKREPRSRPSHRDEPIQFRERPQRNQPAVARRENREAGVSQRDNRRDQATREQRRQPDRQARQDRREPVVREQRQQPERQARREQERRETVVRDQRRQPERQARREQERRETVVRDQRRQPERQARQERRQPERQVRTQRRETESRQPAQRSEPQRQARSERRESRSESRSSGNRRESSGRSERRSRR